MTCWRVHPEMPRHRDERGLCILLRAEGEFSPDPKYLAHKGFTTADTSACGIELLYLPLVSGAEPPKFKDCARQPGVGESGFVLYYTDQCPFTCHWVPRGRRRPRRIISLKVIHVTSREQQAQNVPSPVTTTPCFDGKFPDPGYPERDKKFLKLAGVEAQ